jgi:hypothetical protein
MAILLLDMLNILLEVDSNVFNFGKQRVDLNVRVIEVG